MQCMPALAMQNMEMGIRLTYSVDNLQFLPLYGV